MVEPNRFSWSKRIALGLLIAIAILAGFVSAWETIRQVLVGGHPTGRPVGLPSYDSLYYGESVFVRKDDNPYFSTVRLKRGEDGPWLWMNNGDGFPVGYEVSNACAKRVADAGSGKMFVRDNDEFAVGWLEHYSRIYFRGPKAILYDNDGKNTVIEVDDHHAHLGTMPVSVSLTKNGPRIKFPFQEADLVRAFGKPTKRRLGHH